MNKRQPVLIVLFVAATAFTFNDVKAQSTFSNVHQILQTNCSTSGCHNSVDAAAELDFTASLNEVHASLVNTVPQNAAAAAKGDKLVQPGYIAKSFLYRKIATGFDPLVSLHDQEGALMPDSLTTLSNVDLEIIRQWIQHGAPLNDTVVDIQRVYDFHNGTGLPLVNKPLTPEEEGLEGIQLRIGPILLEPGEEVEYFHKFKAGLDTSKEIYRMETTFDNYSHHFVLFNFFSNSSATYPEGLQNAGSYSAQIPMHLGAKEIGAWSSAGDNRLPPGTAFFWDETTTLVMDYHVRNYNSSMILGAICYINIYTRDRHQLTQEMHMDFPVYGGFNPFILKIPPTGQPYKQEFTLTKPNQTWDLWKMQGHTHRLGTDFDIFLRNPDGTRGRQVYEGFYNSEYTFNQGYFDNQHAPIRTTETPFERVDMDDGLIFEATWVNNGPDTARFGLTTQDEMFASYLTYTLYKNPTSIETPADVEPNVSVHPNPATDLVTIRFTGAKQAVRSLRIFSVEGKMLFQSPEFTGDTFTVRVGDFPKGLHLIETEEEGKSSLVKVLFE